MSNGQLE